MQENKIIPIDESIDFTAVSKDSTFKYHEIIFEKKYDCLVQDHLYY